MSRCAVILLFAPMKGERKFIQNACAYSWSLQKDIIVYVPYFGEEGVRELCNRYGFIAVDDLDTLRIDGKDYPKLSSIYNAVADELPLDVAFVCHSTGDTILVTPNVVSALDLYGDDFAGYVRRVNIPSMFNETNEESTSLLFDSICQHSNLHNVNYPGVDTFFWSTALFQIMASETPPLNPLAWGLDRWLMSWTVRKPKNVYIMNNNIKFVHMRHCDNGTLSSDGKKYFDTSDVCVVYNRKFTAFNVVDMWAKEKIETLIKVVKPAFVNQS